MLWPTELFPRLIDFSGMEIQILTTKTTPFLPLVIHNKLISNFLLRLTHLPLISIKIHWERPEPLDDPITLFPSD